MEKECYCVTCKRCENLEILLNKCGVGYCHDCSFDRKCEKIKSQECVCSVCDDCEQEELRETGYTLLRSIDVPFADGEPLGIGDD